jgi:hypothetical protein
MRTKTVVMLSLWGLGCGSGDKDKPSGDSGTTTTPTATATTTPTGPTTTVFTDFTLDFSEVVPSVVHATWTSEVEGTALVEYGLDGAFDLSTPATEASGTNHERSLLGLKTGGAYTVRGVVVAEDGTRTEGSAVELTVPFGPAELGALNVTISEAGSEVADGFVVLSTLGADNSYAGIIDGDAEWVWFHGVDDEETMAIARARPTLDGSGVLFNYYDRDRVEDISGIARVAMDGTTSTRTRTLWAHHDFIELEGGSFGWMGFDFRDIEIDGEVLPVVADNIYEAVEGADESTVPVEKFNFFDDWHEPWYVGPTMDKGAFVPDYHEWTHGNSLMYVAEEDAYYIVGRYVNALVKVHRTDGVKWTMGGPHDEFKHADAPVLWSYPHMSHAWPGGFLAFDNGDEYAPQKSRVVEYSYDEATKEVTEVWSYDEPDGQFIRILGDARRLPGGNTLIAWSPRGILTEVTPEGEIVWKAEAPLGTTVARVSFIPDIYDGREGLPAR